MIARAKQLPSWAAILSWAATIAVVAVVLPAIYVEVTRREPSEVRLPPLVSTTTSRVYVIDWGYHTAIVVPQVADGWLGPPGEEDAPYLEYAWGDRRFYMESNYWPHSVFATLFLPTEAVTYVDGHSAAPDRAPGARAVYARDVSTSQLGLLLSELERWIARDSLGNRPSAFPAVEGYAGRFYPGAGAYIWSDNCNRWTVDRLAAAGLARGGRGVIFSGQVRHALLGFERVSPPAGQS